VKSEGVCSAAGGEVLKHGLLDRALGKRRAVEGKAAKVSTQARASALLAICLLGPAYRVGRRQQHLELSA
jgi:hypothetical protein